MAVQELEPDVHNESDLIEIATRLACEGYWQDIKQVMEVSRVFRYDEQLWDAIKDEPGSDIQKRTRLMYASWKGDLERVLFLLARGARVNKRCVFDPRASPPFAPPADPSGVGVTALMWACEEGHLEVVRELCGRGGNPNTAKGDNTPALTLSLQKGHLEVARELCCRDVHVNAANHEGLTALMVACHKCPLDVVHRLCELGADANAGMKNDGYTALMWASKNGRLQVVLELCKRGANVNAAQTANGRFTALIVSSRNGHIPVVQALLHHGASKTNLCSFGCTAHDYAGGSGANVIALRALLKPESSAPL